MLSKMTVFKLQFKIFVFTLMVLLLVGTLAGYLASVLATMNEASTFWSIALQGLAKISFTLFALLVLTRLWTLLVKGAKALLSLFETEEVAIADSQIDEAPQVRATMHSLAQALARLEQDSSHASLLLYDADQHAARLVALTKVIVFKADSMRTEAEQLQAAMTAITSGDPLQIARAAGEVRDAHIRELMLCEVQTQGYWFSVTRLIATQLGTLEQWSTGYDKFASNLLSEVSGAKAKLAAMTASLEMIGTVRPFLQLQQNLNEAETHLQPQKQPKLGYALKALPSVSAGSHNLNQPLAIDEAVFRELE